MVKKLVVRKFKQLINVTNYYPHHVMRKIGEHPIQKIIVLVRLAYPSACLLFWIQLYVADKTHITRLLMDITIVSCICVYDD